MDSALPPRSQRMADLRAKKTFDALIIGGGATGVGIALDLAARGLDVACVEQGDWAQATSSSSSRLIHGGLRYLEQYDFGLVRESCLERALLMRNAAGLVWPETFAFPVQKGDRVGRPMLMAGLFLYTALSIPRRLGWPGYIGATALLRRVPGMVKKITKGAGTYLDGATDDARLTLAAMETAVAQGAVCVSRVRAERVEDLGDAGALVHLTDRLSGESFDVSARSVVLAGGPFTEGLRARAGLSGPWISATRGSHVLVDRERLPTEGAVIFTSKVDGRVMFLIPWVGRTAIGTTDIDADPAQDNALHVTPEEVDYLIASANGLVPDAKLTRDDVQSTWVGLRPLLAAPDDDPSKRSREERIEREGSIYTIAGGKLTGWRAMAEEIGVRVARDLGKGHKKHASPTRDLRLAGCHAEPVERPGWSRWAGMDGAPPSADQRLAWTFDKRYAARASEVMARVKDTERLDAETLLGELEWAIEREDCLGLVDFLFRRTDLGYAPLDELDAAVPKVLSRMTELLDWDAERAASEQAELGGILERLHGWRAGAAS